MFIEERQSKIIALVEEHKSISVAMLSKKLGVSVDTIRRDLKQLEQEDLIIKTHGGVMSKNHNLISTKVPHRKKILVSEKSVIGMKAADYIKDNDVIFLDGSSTTMSIIPYLKMDNLTIVTNSIFTAKEIIDYDLNCTLNLIGGKVFNAIGSTIFTSAIDDLEKYRFNKVILSCCSVDIEKGFFDIDSDEAAFKRKVIERTDTILWLLDHSKFSKYGHIMISPINGIIISDNQISEAYQKRFVELYHRTIL